MEKLNKLAAEIVENLVDCDSADPEPIEQYEEWTRKQIAEAFSALERGKQADAEYAKQGWQCAGAVATECDALKKDLVDMTARAEAAEAKLAELEKQEPAAFTSEFYWQKLNESGLVNCWLRNDNRDPDFNVRLFTRPAHAVSLANLVPDEIKITVTEGIRHGVIDGKIVNPHRADGYNECIAAILRNIEENKK